MVSSSQPRRPSSMDSSVKLGQSRPFFFADNVGNDGDDDSSTSLSSDEDLYVHNAGPAEVVALADSLVHVNLPLQKAVDPNAPTPRSKKTKKHPKTSNGPRPPKIRFDPNAVKTKNHPKTSNGPRPPKNRFDVDAVTPRVPSARSRAAGKSKRPLSPAKPSNLSGLGLLDQALSPPRGRLHKDWPNKGQHNRHLLSTPRSSDETEVKQVHIKASAIITPTSMPQRVKEFEDSTSVFWVRLVRGPLGGRWLCACYRDILVCYIRHHNDAFLFTQHCQARCKPPRNYRVSRQRQVQTKSPNQRRADRGRSRREWTWQAPPQQSPRGTVQTADAKAKKTAKKTAEKTAETHLAIALRGRQPRNDERNRGQTPHKTTGRYRSQSLTSKRQH